jgi:hypothetical protein
MIRIVVPPLGIGLFQSFKTFKQFKPLKIAIASPQASVSFALRFPEQIDELLGAAPH